MIDLEKFEIADNMMYMILPGQIQKLEPKTVLLGYKIYFSEDFLFDTCALIPSSFVSFAPGRTNNERNFYLPKEVGKEVEDVFEMILWEYANENPFKPDILQGLLMLLMSNFRLQNSHQTHITQNNHESTIFTKFISKVDERYCDNKNVSYYASELALTPGYLTELVKKISGYSPRHHIRQRVLLEAKRKAMGSNKSAKQISFDLGFEDPAMFSKYFKNVAGLNFTEFRSASSLS